MLRLFTCIMLMLLLNGPPLDAQQNQKADKVSSFTIEQAQSYALEHNRSLQNRELDKERAEEDVTETLSQGLPQVSAEGRARRNFDVRTNVISFGLPGQEPQKSEVRFGTNYRAQASVNVSQMIFDGTFFLGLKASRVYVNLSKKQYQQSRRDTRAKVAKAYYSCLVTQRNKAILQKNVEQVEQNLYETRQRFQNGMVEELDVDRQRLTLQNLRNQLSKVSRERDVARKLLKFQMGYPIGDSLVLQESLQTQLPDLKTAKSIPSDFQPEQRLGYQELEVREKLAALSKRRYQAAYLPKLDAFATHLQLAQRDGFNFLEGSRPWFPSTYAGLSLSIPIFSGFQKSARIQKAKIDLKKLQNRKQNLEEQIRLQVQRSLRTYNNALDRAQKQQQNRDLARKIYNQAQTKYDEGVGSSLELTSAQNQLFEAQSAYINAMQDYLVAEIDLAKAVGNY